MASAPLAGERIEVIDALRGFALVGILFINITTMGGPIYAEHPAGAPALSDGNWLLWFFGHLFVYGSMRGVFSMLFGASALLFLRTHSRTAFARRCFWLLIFGIVNSTLLLWPGDILLVYALASPVVLLFLRVSTRSVLIAAGGVLLLLCLWSYWRAVSQQAELDEPAAQALALREERAARLGDYPTNLAFLARVGFEWTFTPGLLWWVLDAAAFMLLGMAFFRFGWLSGAARTSTYAALALVGFGVGLPVRTWETMLAWHAGGAFPPVTMTTFQIGRALVSIGWIGAFMWAWRAIPWRGVFAPLSALGKMALTGYLSQSAIAAVLFSGFGLALWDRLSWVGLWALVLPIMAALALLFMTWLKFFRMGPVEWLWRWLTFGKPPPIRRESAHARAS